MCPAMSKISMQSLTVSGSVLQWLLYANIVLQSLEAFSIVQQSQKTACCALKCLVSCNDL
jgi:hypothetical protein